MGYYVNPEDCTKEEWLDKHGELINPKNLVDIPPDTLPVCLVDNGYMTAAGIAYDKQEMEEFLAPDHGPQRPRTWYLVRKELLKPFMDEMIYNAPWE